jgi:hypothetical protein
MLLYILGNFTCVHSAFLESGFSVFNPLSAHWSQTWGIALITSSGNCLVSCRSWEWANPAASHQWWACDGWHVFLWCHASILQLASLPTQQQTLLLQNAPWRALYPLEGALSMLHMGELTRYGGLNILNMDPWTPITGDFSKMWRHPPFWSNMNGSWLRSLSTGQTKSGYQPTDIKCTAYSQGQSSKNKSAGVVQHIILGWNKWIWGHSSAVT